MNHSKIKYFFLFSFIVNCYWKKKIYVNSFIHPFDLILIHPIDLILTRIPILIFYISQHQYRIRLHNKIVYKIVFHVFKVQMLLYFDYHHHNKILFLWFWYIFYAALSVFLGLFHLSVGGACKTSNGKHCCFLIRCWFCDRK